jgi:hypothetical protein
MRIAGLFMVAALAACGGATSGTSDPAGEGTTADPTGAGGAKADPPGGAHEDPPASGGQTTPSVVGETCANPTTVIAASGGSIARPVGSALRLQLVYQGSSIGITQVRGVDKVLSPADGPFTAGKVSGYWFETRSPTTTTYQRLFQDPTNLEAPGDPGGGGFMNFTIDRCTPKHFLADVPNDPSSRKSSSMAARTARTTQRSSWRGST